MTYESKKVKAQEKANKTGKKTVETERVVVPVAMGYSDEVVNVNWRREMRIPVYRDSNG